MSEQSNSRKFIIGGIIILLLLLLTYFAYSHFSKSNTIELQETALIEADSVNARLAREYNTAIEQLEAQKSENQELNLLIENQQEDLLEKRKKIERLIARNGSQQNKLNEALVQIESLVVQRDMFLKEIERLRLENKELGEKADKFEVKSKQFEAEKDVLQDVIKTERADADKTLEEKAELEEKAAELEAKVDRAAVLAVSGLTASGINIKRSGKEVTTNRSSRSDLIRVCFEVMANAITPPGSNDIFLRIINEKGETLAIESEGSGVLLDRTNEKEARYTISRQLDFQNTAQNVCLDWPQDDFDSGTYTVIIYNKGYRIGESSFSLK